MKKEKNTKKKWILIGTVGVLVIGLVCVLVGVFYGRNPKVLFVKNVETLSKKIVGHFDKPEDMVSQFMKQEEQIQVTSLLNATLPSSLQMDPFAVDVTYQLNKKEQQAGLQMHLKQANMSLLDLESYLTKDKTYFRFPQVMEEYYYVLQPVIDTLQQESSKEDVEYLLDIFFGQLQEQLKKEMFKTKYGEKIDILGDEKKLDKITLQLDEKFVQEVVVATLQKIKDDSKAMLVFKNFSSESITDLIKKVQSQKVDTKNTLDIHLYIDGTKALRYELVIEEVMIAYTEYKGVSRVQLFSNNQEMVRVEVDPSKKQEQISGFFMAMINFVGTYEKKDAGSHFEMAFYTVGTTKEDAILTLKMDQQLKEVTAKEKYQSLATFTLQYANMDTAAIEECTVSVDTTIQKGTLVLPELSNSKDIETLTEEEQNQLLIRIGQLPIFQLLQSNVDTTPVVG